MSQESNHSSLKCLCNHLTAFGGDILVAPNTIDFQLVQQAFDDVDPEDLLVLITLCSTFLVYFLVLVKARRADKVDATKVGMESKNYRIKIKLKFYLIHLEGQFPQIVW